MDRSSCPARRHGTYSAHHHDGCCCDDAREDYFRYRKAQRLGVAKSRRIPALGYSRMSQALMATGWSYTDQARLCGVSRSTLEHLAHHPWVSRQTARKVGELFADFTYMDGPNQFAAAQAWALAYPPPGAWIGRDIHDPAAVPVWIRADDPDEVAAQLVALGHRRWAALHDEAERVAAYRLATHAGVSKRTMQTRWQISSRAFKRMDGAA